MSKMPEAKWVGEKGSRKMSRYDIVCVHTIVGKAPAHAAHFSTSMDGEISQSRDTKFQSAANLEGNPRVIAIENADMPPLWKITDGHAVPAFSDAQCEAIAQILAWVHKEHGIPLVLCSDSKSTSRGVAYHRQGVDGNFLGNGYKYGGRVPGGEKWSTSGGKVCPGDRRIEQLIVVILPRAIKIVGGVTPAIPSISSGDAMFASCVHKGTIYEAMIGTDTAVYWRMGKTVAEVAKATAQSLGGGGKSVNCFISPDGLLTISVHGGDDRIHYNQLKSDLTWTGWTASSNIKLFPSKALA